MIFCKVRINYYFICSTSIALLCTPFMNASLHVNTGYRQILKIAMPISLALLVPQLNFIINNVFLGHLSEEALAVASITGVYYLVFSGIGYGLNNGLQALISRRAGENRPEEIGRIFQQGIAIAMLIAASAILFTYFVSPFILKATLQSEATYNQSVFFCVYESGAYPFSISIRCGMHY